MLSVLSVVFGLGVIVLIHELGHFLTAKAVGLEVPRFSIGFPPHILKLKFGSTEYCIGAIPLGGYVKVNLGTTGDTPPNVSWYKRALVTLAGPFANFILAIVLVFLIFGVIGLDFAVVPSIIGNTDNQLYLAVGDTILTVNDRGIKSYQEASYYLAETSTGTMLIGTSQGRVEMEYSINPDSIIFNPLIPVIIDEAMVGMPAFEAGIRSGDSLIAVNGETIGIWAEFQEIVYFTIPGEELKIVYLRDGQIDTAYVAPEDYDGRILTGVTVRMEYEREKFPLGEAFITGVKGTYNVAKSIVLMFVHAFKDPEMLVKNSGGPVFVAETLSQRADSGLPNYLEAIASISVAIMIFNLLPIPVLDGGQTLLLIYEGIRGKPMSKKKIEVIQNVGVVLILTLFALIMFKDISRIVTRVR